jgi:hypothetical protein
MILLIIFIAVFIVLSVFEPAIKRWSDPKSGAERIRRACRQIYVTHHDLVEVQSKDFSHLDLAFYDSTTKTFAEHGFRMLGDFEDRTISGKLATRRTFIRGLTDDESVGVGIYNFQLSGWARWAVPFMRNLRVVDVGSEFSDGRFLTTTNAWHARHVRLPPEIDTAFHRSDTSVETLLREHRTRLRAYLERNPNSKPVVSATLQDEFASVQRSAQHKAEFRAQLQYHMTRDELRALAADLWIPGSEKAACDLADAADGGSTPSRPRGVPEVMRSQVFGWIVLVLIFVVVYRWTVR